MKAFAIYCTGLYLAAATGAHAADAEAGKRLAQLRCAACHVVAPGGSNEVADAPPFVAIGRKFDFNYDAIVVALMGPHSKMNFSVRRRDAEDVAAYIGTLVK
jgi:mono/diheme cytochrome c family protein